MAHRVQTLATNFVVKGVYMEETRVNVVPQKRISWSAVLAGVVTVLALQLVLGMFGVSVGMGTIDPLAETNPLSGLGVGAAIWVAATMLLSLFAGGWIAGKLSAVPKRSAAGIHGFLTWGLATFALFFLLTSAVGGVLRGATGVIGGTLSALGRGASTVAKEGIAAIDGKVDLGDIEQQATALLAGPEGDRSKKAGAGAGEIAPLLKKAFGGETPTAADKEAVVNALVSRTDMTRAQATRTVDGWETSVGEAKAKIVEAKAAAEQKAREAGDAVAKATSKAAGWSALLLALGALAAYFGAFVGAPLREDDFLVGRGEFVAPTPRPLRTA